MTQSPCGYTVRRFCYGSFVLVMLLLAGPLAISADDRGEEVIDATAMGTSTQMGRVISVKVIINEFSTDDDRAILVDAFTHGQNEGLVNHAPDPHANRPQDSFRHEPGY
jgi:hypothetical protein